MSITKVAEGSMKLVSSENNQRDIAEPRKATPIGVAAAKDSFETQSKEQEQLADDAKSTYEDAKELFKQALRTLKEMEERRSQVVNRLD